MPYSPPVYVPLPSSPSQSSSPASLFFPAPSPQEGSSNMELPIPISLRLNLHQATLPSSLSFPLSLTKSSSSSSTASTSSPSEKYTPSLRPPIYSGLPAPRLKAPSLPTSVSLPNVLTCIQPPPLKAIRKKSGELVKPSLKHTTAYPFVESSSSALSVSEPPSPSPSPQPLAAGDGRGSRTTGSTTPSGVLSVPQTPSSKMVHFDAQLEHVKLFLAEQKPAAVSRDGSPTLDMTTTDTEGETETDGDGGKGGGYFAQRRRGSTSSLTVPQRTREKEEETARRVEPVWVNFTPGKDAQQQPVLDDWTNVKLIGLSLSRPPPAPSTLPEALASASVSAGSTATNASGASSAHGVGSGSGSGPTTPAASPSSGPLLTLVGRILVRNVAYSKWVTVRFTLDEWQTVSEVSGKWIRSARVSHSSPGGKIIDKKEDEGDIFEFAIKLDDHIVRIGIKTLMFCIRFSIPGEWDNTWWDNNDGKNYVVKFKIAPPPPVSVSVPPKSPVTSSQPLAQPTVQQKSMTLSLPQRRRSSGSDRDASDGGTSSPEPEDLRRRLEGLKEHQDQQQQSRQRLKHRTGSSSREGIFLIARNKGRADLDAIGTKGGKAAEGAADPDEDESDDSLDLAYQKGGQSSVPFPSTSSTTPTSNLREKREEVGGPVRRSQTFPSANLNAELSDKIFESFGPYIGGGSASSGDNSGDGTPSSGPPPNHWRHSIPGIYGPPPSGSASPYAYSHSYPYPYSHPSPSHIYGHAHSHPHSHHTSPHARFSSTLFPADAFGTKAELIRGSPREGDDWHGSSGGRRHALSLETPPLGASTSWSGPSNEFGSAGGGGRRRHHQRNGYFDSWISTTANGNGNASSTTPANSKELEVASSDLANAIRVRLTPPGTPLDAIKRIPQVGAGESGSEESEGHESVRVIPSLSEASSSSEETTSSSSEDCDDNIEPMQLPVALSASSSTDTITPDSGDPRLQTEIDSPLSLSVLSSTASTPFEGSTASSTSASSPSEDMDMGIERRFLPLAIELDEEEKRRRYSDFVSQYCFFTGTVENGHTQLNQNRHIIDGFPASKIPETNTSPRMMGSSPPMSNTARFHNSYTFASPSSSMYAPEDVDSNLDSHLGTSPTASPNLTPTRGRSRTSSLQSPPSPRRTNSDSNVLTKSLSFPGSNNSMGYLNLSERMGIVNRARGLMNRSPSPGELITSSGAERNRLVGFS